MFFLFKAQQKKKNKKEATDSGHPLEVSQCTFFYRAVKCIHCINDFEYYHLNG